MKIIIAIAWVFFTCLLGYVPAQSDFLIILGGYVSLFFLYLLTYRLYRSHQDVLIFVFLSIIVRGCLVFAFPNLSDDIYRFLWDGHLIMDGVNPFRYTPSEWLAQSTVDGSSYQHIYSYLNSPDYYSVYPPISQLVFAACVKVFPDSLYWATVLMKTLFVGAEVSTIYILLKILRFLRLPMQRVLLYALNPLVIIELTGNLHFEAIMIAFFVMALWAFMRKQYVLFGIFMALSIGTKLLPLMLLPFFLMRMRWKNILVSLSSLSVVMLAMFLPFFNFDLYQHFFTSINLYFQKFEFNASIYYVMRWLGTIRFGYNPIATVGPILSVTTFLIIMGLVWFERSKRMRRLLKSCLFAFTTYLLMGTTIHPWYLAMPVLLSIFTYYRYAIFWSGLILLTYINYAYEPYFENLWIVSFEYLVVIGIIVIEIFQIPVAGIFMTLAKWLPERLLRQ